MIVVDTSVWVDVINEVDTPGGARCIELLEDGAPVGLTDVVFAEILQGSVPSVRRAGLNDDCGRSRFCG